jgi:flagellar assembly protein FliH
MDACEKLKSEIYIANERYVVDLAYRIAKMVLLRELTTDREYVVRLAKELIEKVGARDNIRLRVNEGDLQIASQIKDGLAKSLGELKNLHIEPSKQVQRGGCILETEWNAINASVDTQLQGIYDSLFDKGTA